MIIPRERPSDTLVTHALSFLWLEITGKCNLACEHCYAGSSPQGTHGSMQPHDWERVIWEAAEMGCKNLQFIGGEPLVYPFLNQLIHLATKLDIGVEVYTNLVSMKPIHWETFKRCNVRVATSFYSLRPSMHEQITNGGKHSFHKTVSNIRHVVQLGLPLRVGLIETRPGQDIEATEQFLRDLGVERIGRDRVRSVGRGTHLIHVAQPEDALCGACAQGKAVVVPSGEVFPCVFSRWLSVGNVCEQSFTEIMLGQATIATRQKLQTFFSKKFPTLEVCEPDDCEPFCEPWVCNPDIPPCRPNTLCLPDFKDPCTPVAPCPPDEEKCPPDWDPPKK